MPSTKYSVHANSSHQRSKYSLMWRVRVIIRRWKILLINSLLGRVDHIGVRILRVSRSQGREGVKRGRLRILISWVWRLRGNLKFKGKMKSNLLNQVECRSLIWPRTLWIECLVVGVGRGIKKYCKINILEIVIVLIFKWILMGNNWRKDMWYRMINMIFKCIKEVKFR